MLPFLRCPHCTGGLYAEGPAVRCAGGHAFDLARQGYVSLLSHLAHTGTADTAAMVMARLRFLAGGHYAPIASAVTDSVTAAVPHNRPEPACVVELGAGTGYYLAAVLDALPAAVGIALDVSQPAVRRATRAHPRIGVVRADVWGRLPLRDGVVSAVLGVFAPRNPAETARVLRRGGAYVTVTPTPEHLAGLVAALALLTVDPGKTQRVGEQLDEWFVPAGQRLVVGALSLGAPDVRAVVEMGPSAHHTTPRALAGAVEGLSLPWADVLSVTVATWRRR